MVLWHFSSRRLSRIYSIRCETVCCFSLSFLKSDLFTKTGSESRVQQKEAANCSGPRLPTSDQLSRKSSKECFFVV